MLTGPAIFKLSLKNAAVAEILDNIEKALVTQATAGNTSALVYRLPAGIDEELTKTVRAHLIAHGFIVELMNDGALVIVMPFSYGGRV